MHFLVGAAFLVIGGVLQLLTLMALRFADLFPVSYGRLEPMSNLALMIGFGAISLLGGVYYVLPRLTGAPLSRAPLARLALLGIAVLVVAGLVVVGLGLGDGAQPLGLPVWLDIPLFLALWPPLIVTMGTIRRRQEKRTFVTLWFVIGGVTWLPLLYLANLAGVFDISSVASAYADTFFSAGFVTMFLITVGSGLVYYTIVKELDVPLASRQLAAVGFWSLGFAAAWWGAAQLLFGPGPGWVAGVAAALGLAFPLGTLANAANVTITLEGSWGDLERHPGVFSGVLGLSMSVGIAVMAALAGFRSIGSVASLTAYWEAIEYVALGGVSVLLVASVALTAIPRLSGRELADARRARRFNRQVIAGSVGLLLSLGAAGLVTGYSWIAGSNSNAYVDAGDGWGTGSAGSFDFLVLIAVLFGIVLLVGQIGYATLVYGTLARGKAVPQELVVAKETEE